MSRFEYIQSFLNHINPFVFLKNVDITERWYKWKIAIEKISSFFWFNAFKKEQNKLFLNVKVMEIQG